MEYDWWTALVFDALVDALKLFPFLLITYLLLEWMEQKAGDRTVELIGKSGRAGPLVGAVCGLIPQCGLAAAASNFYAARVISAGTLMAVYLATSDEMLPILISSTVPSSLIIRILLIKFTVALLIGSGLDFVGRRGGWLKKQKMDIETLCRNQHCECGEGIWRPALRHSVKITLFVLVIGLLFGLLMEMVGVSALLSLRNYPLAGPAAAGVIGLIPNCSASVIVTQLYLQGAISFGALAAGALSGAGVGLLVLFRVNPRPKENLLLAFLLYVSGVLIGSLIDFWY